jgi:hypothetical protein
MMWLNIGAKIAPVLGLVKITYLNHDHKAKFDVKTMMVYHV